MQGLHGFNRVGTSTNILLGAYGNDVVDVATGRGYSLNLDQYKNAEFATFLDRVFIQNYDTTPKTFNGTTWDTTYVRRCMRAKYIKPVKAHARVYLGFCKFSGLQVPLDKDGNEITFPNRIFFSDLFVANNLTWGLEWGRNGRLKKDSPYFDLDQPLAQDFVASNIKVGDPLVITNGDAGLTNKTFYVKTVITPFRLELTEVSPVTATGQHYWVGSNWFDAGGDDNDSITALAENSSQLIVSKLYSLFTYASDTLRQVPDALGASSGRSMLTTKSGLYYFHGSDPKLTGIYRYDGSTSNLVSRQVDPFIRGMNPDSYTKVVGWREGEELRFYLGNIDNSNHDISMDSAVATLNSVINGWDVSPIADVITCSSPWKYGNEQDYYCGTNGGQVLRMGRGNNFNGKPIAFALDTKVYYPTGSEVINAFTIIQVIGRATAGIRVKYRLWDMPKTVDEEWLPLGELNADKTELLIPNKHQLSSGIQLRFEGMDTRENDCYVEKLTIFYQPKATRLI